MNACSARSTGFCEEINKSPCEIDALWLDKFFRMLVDKGHFAPLHAQMFLHNKLLAAVLRQIQDFAGGT